MSVHRLAEQLRAYWITQQERYGRRVAFGISGPTAVGKTRLSLDLAAYMNAEIISGDSRQVYRQLDVGTAKPTTEERSRIRHHFIDERDLDEPWTAVGFAEDASARIGALHAAGKNALVVGGSTLYMDALLFGHPGAPPTPPELTAELEAFRKAAGDDALVRELVARAPHAGESVDLTNPRRVVRALALLRSTGKLPSAFPRRVPPEHPSCAVILTRPRVALYARIEARCDAMLADGLVDEVAGLREQGWPRDSPALRTIGYQEPWAYLEGKIAYDEMVRLLKRNTRRYAKRQLTFFRRQWPEISSFDVST